MTRAPRDAGPRTLDGDISGVPSGDAFLLSASSCSSITTTTARSGTGAHTVSGADRDAGPRPGLSPVAWQHSDADAGAPHARRAARRATVGVTTSAGPRRAAASTSGSGSTDGGRRTTAPRPISASGGRSATSPPIGTVPMSGSGSRDTSVGGDAAVRIVAARPAHRCAAHVASSTTSAGGPMPRTASTSASVTPAGGDTSTPTIHRSHGARATAPHLRADNRSAAWRGTT